MRRIKLAAVAVALSGCLYDGSYLVRGTVLGARRGGASQPIAGAQVSVSAEDGGGGDFGTTGADGSFELDYRWGGMMPFTSGDGEPRLRVRASGYEERDVKLDGEMPPGVTQRPCTLGQRGCRHVEVVLAPEPVPTS
jgi:hypothetical protein